MSGDRPGDDDASTPDYRQVAFVSLALVGVVLAAFVAPPVPEGSGDGAPGGPSVSADGGFLETILRILLRFLLGGGGGGGGEPACRILLHDDPTPGHDLAITVLHDGEPVEDAVVWYNDRRVGRTDGEGSVTGTVPYQRELRIRVVHEDLVGCSTGDVDGSRLASPVDRRTGTASVALGTSRSRSSAVTGRSIAGRSLSAEPQEDDDEGNESVTHRVDGDVEVAVEGDTYPGDEVTIEASVEGVPMRDATVTVDGREVGQTNDEGRLRVRVPDDGTDEMTVTVARGDFSGTVSVNVLLLQVRLRPEGLLLVPGGEATAVATLGEKPASDAVVSVDGGPPEPVDENATRAVTVPGDPTAPVQVRTDRQTAQVTLLSLYWLPATLFAVLVGAVAAVAHRLLGLRAAAGVVGTAGALLTVVVVQSYFGNLAAYATVGAFVVPVLLAVALRWRSTVASGASSAGSAVPRVWEWLLGRALWLAGSLGHLVDWGRGAARRLLAWVRTLPLSVSGLLRRFAAGVETYAARFLAAVREGRIGARHAGGLALVLALLAGGYHFEGRRGLAAVAGTLVLGTLAVVVWRYASRSFGPEPVDSTGSSGSSGTATASSHAPDGAAELSLREMWRGFARTVVPGEWRTSTPGEVARAAVEAGYPAEPVRSLATVFREVEYGQRTLAAATRDRVEDAYEVLVEGDDESPERDPELEGETS